MRLFELEQESNGRPEIFLDMDGVLADFFAEYAKLAGVGPNERGRYDYHAIPPEKREPVIQQMAGTDFFYRLPKFASADRLVAMAVQVFGSYNICSSPLRGDHENSRAMKTAWIQENLNPQPIKIIITPRKGKYAKQPDGTPNILVDDRNTVISEWEQSGGIGIKYQADEDGLDTVARGLRRAFEIIKGRREHTPQNIQSKDYGKMIAGPEHPDTVKEAALPWMPQGTDAEDNDDLSDLKEAMENWQQMYADASDIATILNHPYSQQFKRPPAGIQHLYRGLMLKGRSLKALSGKSNRKLVAYATNPAGAHVFLASLDLPDEQQIIIEKQFNPGDFLLDYTALYESVFAEDLGPYSRYEREYEVWMRATPYYTSIKEEEIVNPE
jgi:hypothetical protein